MTTGRINQIAIHFPSPFLLSRRRSARVLEKEKSPETRSPQAVQTCTAQRRFGVCFISVRGTSCWLYSFVDEINEEDTHLQHVACSFNESCSPLGVLVSRRHAWIVHPSLLLTDRTTVHRVARLRTMGTAFAARSPPQGLATPAFGVWLLSRVLSVVRPVREV